MEKLLGAELLTRSTHRLELTPVGAEVLARTDFLVNTVEVALRDIESTVQRGRAFVRIGVIPSASGSVAAAVADFLRETGRVLEFAWRDAPSTTLLAEVRSGQLDMAVAAITEPPGGLACVDLFRDPLVLVVRRDHALAQKSEVNWEAIGSEQLVLFESGSMPALGNPARAQFAQGAEPYRVSYSETLYALVRGGLALGLMPRLYTALAARPRTRGAAAGEAAGRTPRGAGLPAGADAQRGGAGADRLSRAAPAAAGGGTGAQAYREKEGGSRQPLVQLGRHVDRLAHARIDLRVPLAAAEHAVVPDARLQVVDLQVGPHAGAQVLRGDGLADGADVVALALDGEQRGAADGGGVDLALAHREHAARQVVGLEHALTVSR